MKDFCLQERGSSNSRIRTYQYIKDHNPSTRQEISKNLGLSYPTVANAVKVLVGNGLIVPSFNKQKTEGRSAVSYDFCSDTYCSIGLYLAQNKMTFVLADLRGEILDQKKVKAALNLRSDGYLKYVGEQLKAIVQKNNILPSNLLGVGIALPGLISRDGEYVQYGHTSDFTGVTKTEISKYIPYKTALLHDSDAGAFAELNKWPDMRDAFYISLSSSVGGALMLDRKIVHGQDNWCGEIGHMKLITDRNAGECYCGHRGCFDTVCRCGVLDVLTDGNIEEFFEILHAGDRAALGLWNTYTDHLAMGVHNIHMLLDIPVILGGYVGELMKEDLPELRKKINSLEPFNSNADDFVFCSRSGADQVAEGAALIQIRIFENEI
ncbi:ROK family transcriptional regulator [Bilifractor porci]|jgi:predicted NBD/HSP70 family sugar kinase|uniref:ROK family transcriptional regulator n=1 Tax=Bilifractor porci TaxID=2606636 RepID=A0A7X2P8W9_9FIRM|nr:ROK family transcriptional regulator [Bilifractor porci]MST82409.1 ROK family transcriptional regulator [Bilifractor porci]